MTTEIKPKLKNNFTLSITFNAMRDQQTVDESDGTDRIQHQTDHVVREIQLGIERNYATNSMIFSTISTHALLNSNLADGKSVIFFIRNEPCNV